MNPKRTFIISYIFLFFISFFIGKEAQASDKKMIVVFTSAQPPTLSEKSRKQREEQYIKSLIILRQYGYKPYVCEACIESPPSFFEKYTDHVFYAKVNDYSLKNKGINEAKSLLEFFKNYDFDDETIIVKITGRYYFNSRYFLNFVENHPEFDAIARPDPDRDRITTGCFALRCKFFKEILNQLDFKELEDKMIDLEIAIGTSIRKFAEQGKIQAVYLDKLDLTADIWGADYQGNCHESPSLFKL